MNKNLFLARNLYGLYPIQNTGSGGGGGTPLGEATIWNSFSQSPTAYADWAALATIVEPRENDEALVLDSNGSGVPAIARWSAIRSQWELWQGEFPTLDSILSFPQPIRPGATTLFGSRAFQRTSLTAPDASKQDLWLPAQVEGGTPVLRGYAIGTEANEAALDAKGVEKFGSFTTTQVDDYIRFDGFAGSGEGGFRAKNATVAAGTRIYMRATFRRKGNADAGNHNLLFFAHNTTPSNTVRFGSNGGSTIQPVDNSLALVGSTAGLTDGGSNFDTTFRVYEFIDTGSKAGCMVFRDGVFYGQANRTIGSNTSYVSTLYGMSIFRDGADSTIGTEFKDLIMMEF
jgi:hypothetical protein